MFFLLHSLWRRNCDEVNPFCHIQEDQSDLGNYVLPVFVQQGAFIHFQLHADMQLKRTLLTVVSPAG